MEDQRGQQSRHFPPQAYSPDVCSEEEIDLVELWRVLVRQWKVIGAITGLSVLGAVAYVLLAPPVYEAQAVMGPPESKYVEALNIPDISQITSADIFARFTWHIKSNTLWKQFLELNQPILLDGLPNIREGSKNEAGRVFVSLKGHDAKHIADWLNGFILSAEKKTLDEFFAGVETKIANQKKVIENQLQIERDSAAQRRIDRVVMLEEQIGIASVSNISDRILSNQATGENQSSGVTLNTVQESLYLRGVKDLIAEKEALQKRKNDEPFIAGFRDKQESLTQLDTGLKQLQAAREMAHVVTVDQQAIQPKSPVKPRRMLVLALSAVLGGMLGVFTAFGVNLAQQQKRASVV